MYYRLHIHVTNANISTESPPNYEIALCLSRYLLSRRTKTTVPTKRTAKPAMNANRTSTSLRPRQPFCITRGRSGTHL
jgi:hypothetical protein